MENNPYQRKGVSSNTHAGKDFENKIFDFLEKNGISTEHQKKIEIGIIKKKEHVFDFGNNSILVECKSQTWTETGNVPSAKIKNWSDAMFSFYLAPKKYKKLFFVEMSRNPNNSKPLLDYFIDHYFYLIPSDVILIDFDTKINNFEFYMYDSNNEIRKYKDEDEFWSFLK